MYDIILKLPVSSASNGWKVEPIQLFHFVANGVHDYEKKCVLKKKELLKFAIFHYFYLLAT